MLRLIGMSLLDRMPRPTPTRLAVLPLAAALLGAGGSPAAGEPGDYAVPLSARPTVVTGYDAPAKRWQSGHRGVDLAAAPGTEVLAAGSGSVRFAGAVAGKQVVSIIHADGIITTYEPVRPRVRRGERIHRGEVIGTVEPGHPGCPVAACLHWGARVGTGRAERYLDPLGLLGAVRVRLKPV